MAIFIIVLFSLIAVYWGLNLIMQYVPEAEAGPIGDLSSTGVRRMSGNIPTSFKKKEDDGSVSIHRNFIVKGKCMEKMGIKDGSIVDVRTLSKNDRKNIEKFISKDKVVLIYLNDKDFRGYKLRIVKEIKDGMAYTFYYKDDMPVDSSKPHALKDILGVKVNSYEVS